MNKDSFDYNMAMLLVAVIALLAPVVTTLLELAARGIAGLLSARRKSRETYDLHIRDVFEEYIRSAGAAIENMDFQKGTPEAYGAAYQLALFYAPESVRDEMMELNRKILGLDGKHAAEMMDSVSVKLRTATERILLPRRLRRPHR